MPLSTGATCIIKEQVQRVRSVPEPELLVPAVVLAAEPARHGATAGDETARRARVA